MTTDEKTIKKSKAKSQKRSYARLGYTKMETSELVDAMNKLLANYSVHYQKLRNFHWNVKGQDFFDVHEKFEEQYNAAKIASDDVAERIRVFGQTPLSTMHEYLETSNIKESGTDLTAMEMVSVILRDYEMLLEHMFNVIEIAMDNGDSGTIDMINKMVKSTEKNHWMLTAFSKK